MDTKSEVIAKIQKLLRLAKSSNQHEAELAAQRASELMAKYQIESAAVEVSEVKSGREHIVSEHYEVQGMKMKLHWLGTLAHACATLYNGTVLVNRDLWGTSFSFVGFKSELPAMRSLFEHLLESWKSIVEADLLTAKQNHIQTWGGQWAPKDTMKFKHGHGQGFALALYWRCKKLADDRDSQVAAISNSCTSLVLVRGEALVKWAKDNGVRKAKIQQTRGDANGYAAGQRAGSKVALGDALRA